MTGSQSQTGGAICTLDDFLQVSFDYLIVGGGTAGLTLAARLSEDPSVNVGVIEAGKDQTKNECVRTPAMFPQILGIPEYDWMLETVPQVSEKVLLLGIQPSNIVPRKPMAIRCMP